MCDEKHISDAIKEKMISIGLQRKQKEEADVAAENAREKARTICEKILVPILKDARNAYLSICSQIPWNEVKALSNLHTVGSGKYGVQCKAGQENGTDQHFSITAHVSIGNDAKQLIISVDCYFRYRMSDIIPIHKAEKKGISSSECELVTIREWYTNQLAECFAGAILLLKKRAESTKV